MKDKEILAAEINVTPTTHLKGDDVECDIDGRKVHDDAIRLGRDDDYTLTFTLDPQGAYKWAAQDAFVARNGKCPRAGAPSNGRYQIVDRQDYVLTVEARGNGNREVIHYRLNFDNGKTCDPIIIRD